MKRILSITLLFVAPLVLGITWYSVDADTAVLMDEKASEAITKKLPVTSNSWVEARLSEMSLREKIGQFFMVAAYPNKDESHWKEVDSLVEKEGVGGLIFFQGDRENLSRAISRFQSKAKTPLLIGMDAEFGVQMRLAGEERFPYQYTLGAANDVELTRKIGELIGRECKSLGIHINFAPVADVNSNPNNPVIGFRSFGESPKDVAAHVEAIVKGMESTGILTCLKHFPGHGDTDVDSHLDLPVISNSYAHLNAIDFFPFRSGIRAGASSVMMGHLSVPALDPSGMPSSLSKTIIHDYLKKELGFEGLVISDALGMKGVTKKYGKTEVVVRAFEAGNDILLFPEDVHESINRIVEKVNLGAISIEEIDNRCRKILLAKHKTIVDPVAAPASFVAENTYFKKRVYQKALTVVRNTDSLIPFKSLEKRTAVVSIGDHSVSFVESVNAIAPVDRFHFANGTEAFRHFHDKLNTYERVITSFHANTVKVGRKTGVPADWQAWMNSLKSEAENSVLFFGNPLVLRDALIPEHIETVVVGYENHPLAQEMAGQLVMGINGADGRLPVAVNQELKRGEGVTISSLDRMGSVEPEAIGLSSAKLNEIDEIAQKGIASGAFPGCQVLVAIEGKIVYQKAFGHHTYDKKRSVTNNDLYDIASITKIAASTLSAIRLKSEGKFDLNKTLGDYLPELTAGTAYASVRLKDMLAHQAGFTPWIPFYTKTMKEYRPDTNVYASMTTNNHRRNVAEDLWIRDDYESTIYQQILQAPLRAKTYKYSDIGYYFLKKIIEQESGMTLDEFVHRTFYAPMGLQRILYNPLQRFMKEEITPTENDTVFRKQLIHGFVHDQGAAMLGGVGGHAGLFANARDLAAIMQLFLNKGDYAGRSYLEASAVDAFTACQYCPRNRRGAGFDKPTLDRNGGPTTNLVSLSSYGHSGFTGTIAWADPEYQVNYIFLSNRVYPNAENWKLVKMNTRTDIQRVIYEALKERKKIDWTVN